MEKSQIAKGIMAGLIIVHGHTFAAENEGNRSFLRSLLPITRWLKKIRSAPLRRAIPAPEPTVRVR